MRLALVVTPCSAKKFLARLHDPESSSKTVRLLVEMLTNIKELL